MVKNQVEARGVADKNVLIAMAKVFRHLFVPEKLREFAYDDRPLPIGMGATISQPYIVAFMTELLELSPYDRVLEIGTGSGYQAAVISKTALEVVSFERIKELIPVSQENLKNSGINNVRVFLGDGTNIPEKFGHFDAVIVTAASPDIPEYLFEFLNEGGRLVAPVGSLSYQELIKIKIEDGKPVLTHHGNVRFVPLIGCRGWKE
ncbi:protein-L-isoaspartate(D-aspartate) O-methyltransferase [Methanomicrobium sp. W14]|nr:protein-L-isoaspartate(D-aspartate) O-methyltransferase [Methanomicrobium sp. W14]